MATNALAVTPKTIRQVLPDDHLEDVDFAFALAWIEALESGDYTQTIGCLHQTDDGYCCLGVAADVAKRRKIIEASWRPSERWVNGVHRKVDEFVFSSEHAGNGEIAESVTLPMTIATKLGLEPAGGVAWYGSPSPWVFPKEDARPRIFSCLAEANDKGGVTFAEIAEALRRWYELPAS